MNLAKYSLDNTKIIYFFLAVLLIGGITSFGKLGKKEDAPFVIKSAVIMTRYPGAEPAEVERLITEPISREIQSMSGVYKIKSESMYGLSKITFELQPSLSASSIPQKWDELRRKVLNIQPQLPSGASTPTVSDDFGDVFGIYYGLTADDGFTYEEMRNWAERIKTQVVTADGVMKVALFGVQTEVVNIFVSTNKLVGMGIDPKHEEPAYLYLLLLLPLLAAFYLYSNYRKRKAIRKFGDPVLMAQLMPDVSKYRPDVKFWLLFTAIGLFAVLLARPQFGSKLETVKRKGVEVMIALDISNSMLAQDVQPSRLEKAKRLISKLVDGMENDKVGMIVFAGDAFTQLPITSDYISAKMFLESISPSLISKQGTAIGAAINLAARSFTPQQSFAHDP